MPPTLSKPSGAAPASLIYITLGALMTVWSGIWFAYLHSQSSESRGLFYVCVGFLVTGLVLLGIGFALGPIARMSRHAELPPPGAPTNNAADAQNVTARQV